MSRLGEILVKILMISELAKYAITMVNCSKLQDYLVFFLQTFITKWEEKMNKQKLLQYVIEALTQREKSAKQNLETTRRATIEAPGAMQSHSDTTKWQMSRRAEAIERSLFETQQALRVLKSIGDYPPTITKCSGYAIIEVENLDDGSRSKYFLLPAGGGDTYEVDREEITILNMGAPMARAFIGTVAGDEVEVKIQETTRRFSVISVT